MKIHFQFIFFAIWSIWASILPLIAWKPPARSWSPSEFVMSFNIDPSFLGCSVKLKIIKRFLCRRPCFQTIFPFLVTMMSFLKAKIRFYSNFASIFSPIKHNSSVLFLSSNITYFGQKQPIKVQMFEIFECLGQNLLNSCSQFWTDKSIPLWILHHSSLSWHVTPL